MIPKDNPPRPDAVTFLEKAYEELIAECEHIAQYRWPDAKNLERLTVCLSEIGHWNERVYELMRGMPRTFNQSVN